MSSDGIGTRALSADTRPGDGANRVLVVVLGQTRAWELTVESFTSNVLDELGADLALCGGDRDERENPFYERAKFVWRTPEPDDWAEVYDRTVGDSSWRVLLRPGENLFGGVKDTEKPQVGIGALLIYIRRFLRESLERAGITEAYDWLVVTRSDFLWPLPHPDLRYLSDRRIYVFDGEQYGGVSDRHFIVPRRFVKRFLRIPDPVFTDPERLKRRIDRRCAIQGWSFVNPERFLALRLKDLGLWRRVRFLPYVPFLVRAPGGSTAWSVGVFDEELGYYVKYPTERECSQISQTFVRDQESWREYLAPVRGAPARRRLRRAYRERGLYERPFPLREMHVRAYRMARWTLSARYGPRVRERTVARIGGQLRKVPGMPRLLDARLRWIRRRIEASRPEAAARDRDRARLQELGAQGGLRINVGCGPGTLQGWVNVDIVCDWDDVLHMDVTQQWPLADGSADAINSEHFIEHITPDEARAYLKEAARVLRPGGVIRTSTPSLRGVINAYLEANPEILAKYRERVVGRCDAENHADMLNNTFFQWGHRHIYDFETLCAMLEDAGFESIETADFGHSRHPLLRGIDVDDDGVPLRDLAIAVDAVRP